MASIVLHVINHVTDECFRTTYQLDDFATLIVAATSYDPTPLVNLMNAAACEAPGYVTAPLMLNGLEIVVERCG